MSFGRRSRGGWKSTVLSLVLVLSANTALTPSPAAAAAPAPAPSATPSPAPSSSPASLTFGGITAGITPSRRTSAVGETAHFDRALSQGTSLELRPLTNGVETTYVIASAGAAAGLQEHLSLPAGYGARQAGAGVEL